MKEIVQIIRITMTDLIWYWVLLTGFVNFLSIKFCQIQSVELKLPKWVNVNRERFNNILSTISKAKNDGLKTNVDGREITLGNAESLLKGAARRKINGSQFQKEYNIIDDVEITLQKSMFTRSQNRMVDVLLLLGEITKLKDKKIDEQPDTTDMPELESEEPAGQKSSELVVNYQFF